MEFKTIETLAMNEQPLPGEATLIEQACYFGIRSIYRDYRNNNASKEASSKDKRALMNAYDNWQRSDETHTKLFVEQQNRIKRSEDLVSSIMRGVRDGESIDSLYAKCMKCIGDLVGNAVIAKTAKEMEENVK